MTKLTWREHLLHQLPFTVDGCGLPLNAPGKNADIHGIIIGSHRKYRNRRSGDTATRKSSSDEALTNRSRLVSRPVCCRVSPDVDRLIHVNGGSHPRHLVWRKRLMLWSTHVSLHHVTDHSFVNVDNNRLRSTQHPFEDVQVGQMSFRKGVLSSKQVKNVADVSMR